VRDWLDLAVAPPLVRTVPISPAIAAEVATLPESFPRDPADRLIVSTARVWGARLLTSDRRIIEASIVPTLA
jgi:PIN domain nuclease of toxin-antitoxin system